VQKVGVVGAGQMGTGIAYVSAARAGADVIVCETIPRQVETSKKFLNTFVEKQIKKGKMNQEEGSSILSRVHYTGNLEDFKEVEFAIEAAVEVLSVKEAIFGSLDKVVRPDAILASNTSSISITKLGGVTKRPSQVIGMHFFYPVPLLEMVEIVQGLATSAETLQATTDFAKVLKKKTTHARDYPGFISNRVLMPYINEAIIALHEGIGTVEDIDLTMKIGTNVPMGPLTLADFIGLDTCLNIMAYMYESLGGYKYKPSPLLVKYVEAGWLGRKSGRGFYDYSKK
jgi:3-hydroxybutyryl-CoA dehydrogenase